MIDRSSGVGNATPPPMDSSDRSGFSAQNVLASGKEFSLEIPGGPFCTDFSSDGRHLAIAGEGGRFVALEWQKKALKFEADLDDRIFDCKWMHNNTLIATAQSKYIYMYDQNGVEVHRLKKHTDPRALEFLPYHFLLVSVSLGGVMRYHDISTGSIVSEFNSKSGRSKIIRQARSSGVIHQGHSNGTVTLWSPTVHEPLAKVFCHKGPVSGMAVDYAGKFMATAGADGSVKVWDLRNYGLVSVSQKKRNVTSLDFSQKGFLSASHGTCVSVWEDPAKDGGQLRSLPLKLQLSSDVNSCSFCPFEDVLGCATSQGFTSHLVPGSAEADYDSFEVNPFATSRQRREMEVRSLLNKLPPESIFLHSGQISGSGEKGLASPRGIAPSSEPAAAKEGRAIKTSYRRYLRKRHNVVDEHKVKRDAEAASETPQNFGPLGRFIKRSI